MQWGFTSPPSPALDPPCLFISFCLHYEGCLPTLHITLLPISSRWLHAFGPHAELAAPLNLLLWITLTWHWIACTWWFIITHDGSAAAGHHTGTWFITNGSDDAATMTGTLGAYLISLHWAFSTTTVGTSMQRQSSAWQLTLEMIACTAGACMQAIFFGVAAEAYNATHFHEREKQHKERGLQWLLRP